MINEKKMFDNMSIYVCSDMVPYFVQAILPHITNTFYMISGDSDAVVPNGIIDLFHNPRSLEESKCMELLNHPKLIRWFAQNCLFVHEKIEQLPIGLDYHTISCNTNKNWRSPNEG